ncbi:MAG: FAD-dependent oxidoreductase [Desulfovibrio sp.]|nr:FAD-dependent oxidoreductase [Desulfovibrio sp.]MBI4959854.1 FAD-dependent oxidoreductase [Desulfovibrio sp.]
MTSSLLDMASGPAPVTTLCNALAGVGLPGYLSLGGYSSLDTLREMSPGQRAAVLRDSGLRDDLSPAWPVFVTWSAQRTGAGLLAVDARDTFLGDPLPHSLIVSNPFGLIEALAHAALSLGRHTARILLSPGREMLWQRIREVLAEASVVPAVAQAGLTLEVAFETQEPDFTAPTVDPGVFRLGLRTWMRLPAAFSSGGMLVRSGFVLNGQKPVEAAFGDDFRQASGEMGALCLDEGLSGFVAANSPLPWDPELLTGMAVNPGFTQLRGIGATQCPVDLTRQALYQHWRCAAVREGHPHRGLLARAARLATELALGRGGPEQLEELGNAVSLLDEAGLKAARTLQSSLAAFPEEWLEHSRGNCGTGTCRARRVAPCQERCPSGIDIPNFLSLTGRGEHAKAVSIMVQDNPLPYACGLICPAPCEKVCLRGKVDKPIHIRAMKAVSTKAAMEATGGYPPVCQRAASSGRKVAVVGGGPAGLSCASFLARMGHAVTIFESMPKLGGMMRYGIPEYRLPKAILDREIETVLSLGVAVETGKTLGSDISLDGLAGQGFDAVFLGLGAWSSRALGLEGERLLAGVVSGTEFLVELGLGHTPAVGSKVVVVGGGNTAMDCARTAVRLGAQEVRVVYRRSRAEMPAALEEVEEAEHEGVHFTFLAAPTRLVGEGGKLEGMEVITMALGAPDASGRRRPEPKSGTERILACDMIISAIGQFCDESFTQGSDGTLGEVCLTKWKTIQIDSATLATDRPGVFAGGDAAQGPATVVEAIRDGKRAAHAIDAFLRGVPFDPASVEPRPRWEQELLCSSHGCGWSEHERPDIPMISVSARSMNFEQVELGLNQDMAENEARRCLRCDVCIGCGLCQLVCSEAGGDALRFKDVGGRLVFEDFDRPTGKCVGCGACTHICPTGAMRMVLEKGEAAISFTGHAISEIHPPYCVECGKPLPTEQYLEHLRSRIGEQLASSARMDQELCPECARKQKGVSFVASMLR